MLELSDYDHLIIYFALFLSLSLCIQKSVSWRGISLSAALAYAAMTFDLSENLTSNFFDDGVNAQAALVGLSALSVIGLGILIARKRSRSLERSMMFICGASFIGTTLLFHHVLIEGFLHDWMKDAGLKNAYITETPIDEFQARCKEAQVQCWAGKILAKGDVPDDLYDGLSSIHAYFDSQNIQGPIVHAYGALNDTEDDGVAAILYVRKPEITLVVIDTDTGRRVHSLIKNNFYLLDSIAHSIWIFGTLTLMFFHRYIKRRRSNNVSGISLHQPI